MLQVVAAERDTAVFIWYSAQENAEHGLEGVFLSKCIDLIELLHEALQVPFGARWGEANDPGESITFNSGGLVGLQYLHAFDARGGVTLFKADLRLIQEAIDIARPISILHSAHQGLVQFQFHLFQLLGGLSFLNVKLVEVVAVLGALAGEHVDDGGPCIELDSNLLRWTSKVNISSILLVVDILQRYVGNRAPLRLVALRCRL